MRVAILAEGLRVVTALAVFAVCTCSGPALVCADEAMALSLPTLASAPVIDGNLSAWPPKPVAHLNQKKQLFGRNLDQWTGPKSCSGQMRLQWDEENLYLAFSVTDGNLYFYPEFGPEQAMHRSDAVEFFIDADLLSDYGKKSYDEDDTHIKFVPPKGGDGKLLVWRKNGASRDLAVDDIEAVWRKTGAGYTIEARIPWKLLNAKDVKPGTEMGVEALINNRPERYYVVWSADRPRCSKDPTRHGRVILAE